MAIYDPKSMKAEEFINDEEIRQTLAYAQAHKNDAELVDALLEKARSKKTENGGLSSSVGWLGLAKKCMTLLLVLVAHRLDVTLGVDWVRTTVVVAFIVNETISIIENAGLLGIPMPAVLKKAVELLKGKAEPEE